MKLAVMESTTCGVALKEWAVTIRALDQGKQVLLLRKGGIREKEFGVIHPDFFLYPTYEHQQPQLLKEAFYPHLEEVLKEPRKEDQVRLTHWARVEEKIGLTSTQEVEALSPYYIWTVDYVEKRLHWRPRKPLVLMLLRVYRLARPVVVPLRPEFMGCKSWVELPQPVALGDLLPVLDDAEWRSKVEEIKRRLEWVSIRS